MDHKFFIDKQYLTGDFFTDADTEQFRIALIADMHTGFFGIIVGVVHMLS